MNLLSSRRNLACLALAFATSPAVAQQPVPPRLIEQKNGTSTDVSVEGQLAPTRKLDCIAADGVTRDETPPDIYTAIRSCIVQDDYDRAVALFAMAGAFGAFDQQRVADVSARDAPQVLAYLLSGTLSPEQRTRFSAAVKRLVDDAAVRQPVCTATSRVGAPTYAPTYMIRHGMDAIVHPGATTDPLVPGFDPATTWQRVRTTYLHCTS